MERLSILGRIPHNLVQLLATEFLVKLKYIYYSSLSERKIHKKYLFRSDFKNQELQGNTGGEGFGFTAAACDINGKNLNQGTVLGI